MQHKIIVDDDAIESQINDENACSPLLLVLIFVTSMRAVSKKQTFSIFCFSFVAICSKNIGRQVLSSNNFDLTENMCDGSRKKRKWIKVEDGKYKSSL